MTIITFCPPPQPELFTQLQRFLDTQFPLAVKEHLTSLPQLCRRLESPRPQPQVVVLLVPDRACLQQLSALGPKLQGNDLLLILPDSQEQTLALGHRLRPRLQTAMDEDGQLVAEVLAQIIRRAQARSQPWEGRESEEGGPSANPTCA